MHYSRAGLVALVFALIISFVSAFPIPATESRFSSTLSPYTNPKTNGHDLTQLDNSGISEFSFSGRVSTLPLATRLTRRVRYCLSSCWHLPTPIWQQIPTDVNDRRLVRRSIDSKIKHAFQVSLSHFALMAV